jgi:nitrogen regulatory protein P-II 1
MKLIHGMVRDYKIDAVRDALNRINVQGLAFANVKDCSPQEHPTTVWRGHLASLGFTPKVAFTVVVHDDDVDDVVRTIICSARTGCPGDGAIAVIPVEHRYDIRTGERNVS